MIFILGEAQHTRRAVDEVERTESAPWAGHEDHAWRQVGRCVYCECGERLFQGTMPADHKTFTPPKTKTASDRMREKWGKI